MGAISLICWRSAFAGTLSPVSGAFDGELALVFEILVAQPLGLKSVFHDDQRALKEQRLLEKIKCAELGGFHGGFDGGVAGDDDDFRAGDVEETRSASTSRPSRSGSQISSSTVVESVTHQDGPSDPLAAVVTE